jgi:peptide/nickel transport system substrate-binding protein
MNWVNPKTLAALLALAAPAAAQTPALQGPTPLPPARSLATTQITRVPYEQLMQTRALPAYHEPDWVTALVKAGKLPPVEQRLPAEPTVEDMHVAPNGPGVYGGILRHVSGGRPQGWNWAAGQTQGTATLDEMEQECLVTTGPMWQLTQDRIEPLPDLATRWEWSEDGHQLTMHLLKGAKWSDGEPFGADDILFHWNDNVSDPNVPARVQPGVRCRHHAREARRHDDPLDVPGGPSRGQPLQDGRGRHLPGPGAHPQAAAPPLQQECHL